MFSCSLDKFYQKIDRRIKIISAHLEDDFYYWLIKSCKLKPLLSVYGNFIPSKPKFEKEWVDEFGTLISIDKRKFNVTLNSSRVEKNRLIFTDLYDTGSFNIAFSRSKVCMTTESVILLNDGKYLSAWKFEKEYYEVPTLSIDEGIIRTFFKYKDVNDKIKLDKYNGWIFNLNKNKDLSFLEMNG